MISLARAHSREIYPSPVAATPHPPSSLLPSLFSGLCSIPTAQPPKPPTSTEKINTELWSTSKRPHQLHIRDYDSPHILRTLGMQPTQPTLSTLAQYNRPPTPLTHTHTHTAQHITMSRNPGDAKSHQQLLSLYESAN